MKRYAAFMPADSCSLKIGFPERKEEDGLMIGMPYKAILCTSRS
jgi:hypothetical protein